MGEDELLLPMEPVMAGFVLSFALIAADAAYLKSGALIVVGIPVFAVALMLLFIVKGENEGEIDSSGPGYGWPISGRWLLSEVA